MNINLHPNVNKFKKKIADNGYPPRSITELITNGFFTVDQKWTVTYWNKAAEQILSVRAEDIIGKNIWEKFAEIIPPNFYAVYHQAFLQDIPAHFEEYWTEMNAWFDVTTYRSEGTLSISFKSTDQPSHPEHQAYPEQKLKILNELYRYVTEVTNDCLWEWNLETREIFWIDGGHKRVFGYPIENALIPQSFWESLVHPDDHAGILKSLNKIATEGSGAKWDVEYRFKRSNGDYAYVHDRGHIIYDDDNRASRMIGATQDITARKLVEIELFESERKLSLIARQTVNSVVITDNEEKITWVNSAFTRITEYEPEEVMGRKPGSFMQGKETDPSTVQYLRQKIRDKQPFDCEIINYSKSGRKHWMRIQGQALFGKNGNCDGHFAIQTDITEKILLENKLAQERRVRQKEITDAVLTAQEKQRADIGRELHDNLNQILGAAKLYIEMARTDEYSREMCLEKSSGYIVTVIEEIRRISKSLAMPALHVMGLFESIKILQDDLIFINPVEIEFNDNGISEKDLNEKLQLTIFRIVQEQLNNILKHANASHAAISLTMEADKILLIISDNGQGCDISKKNKGTGIINIRTRAELHQGSVAIVTGPGEGYELKVLLSLASPSI